MNFIFTTCEDYLSALTRPSRSSRASSGRKTPGAHGVDFVDRSMIRRSACAPTRTSFTPGRSGSTYTGTLHDSLAAQQAFGAYRGDKMGHTPLTLLRASAGRAVDAHRGLRHARRTVAPLPSIARLRAEQTSLAKAPTIVRTLAALCALSLGAVSAAGEACTAAGVGRLDWRKHLPLRRAARRQAVARERESGVTVEGASAACVNCHRRSGLGAAKGAALFRRSPGSFCSTRA